MGLIYFTTTTVLCILVARSSSIKLKDMENKYFLVTEAYNVTRNLFNLGRNSYNKLKENSVEAINIFLDLVQIMNNEMARELRSAIVKFYKIKYFHDFTNYMISMEEMLDITEHCLMEPIEKLEQVRSQFHDVVNNFEDVRNFDMVNKCNNQLPDEVAVAHCILHQAVLFNETMQESLVAIVTIKTRQHAQDMNTSIYNVQTCLNDFVPNFFEQLLVEAYTDNCGYLKVVNASINDLIKDKWRNNETQFLKKWRPLTHLLKEKLKSPRQTLQEPLFRTLFATNLTSKDIVKSVY
ncbi:hypothetical protein MSG28_013954 [Choristoneura fumiferana]|uniref:Uncharacterized protein n=2 Tax=Choristoneura fumiferana TaxID=7141 RepID=A0ACC0KA97_CHOFU|nr:hypothetical protein MSG28_013954 [Choristoneura fumiferana]